jgi:hypothetical protein
MLRIVTFAGAVALTLAGAAVAQRPPSPPGPAEHRRHGAGLPEDSRRDRRI